MPALCPRRASSRASRITWRSAPPKARPLMTNSTLMQGSGGGAQLARGRLPEQDGAARGTAVEEEIERREPGDEGLRAALRVLGVGEIVPLHRHARAREVLDVEVLARAAEAGE